MNTELRRNTKTFLNLMNNAVFRKPMENPRNHRVCLACDGRSKIELFGVRTKLLYNKNFSR